MPIAAIAMIIGMCSGLLFTRQPKWNDPAAPTIIETPHMVSVRIFEKEAEQNS